jgi:hypothetical protein
MTNKPEVLLDGLMFPEGPRWHAEKLWFSGKTVVFGYARRPGDDRGYGR